MKKQEKQIFLRFLKEKNKVRFYSILNNIKVLQEA